MSSLILLQIDKVLQQSERHFMLEGTQSPEDAQIIRETEKGLIKIGRAPCFKQILVSETDKENRLVLCIPWFKEVSPSTINFISSHWQVCWAKSPNHQRHRRFCKMKFHPVYQDEWVKSRSSVRAAPVTAAGVSCASSKEDQLMRGESLT